MKVSILLTVSAIVFCSCTIKKSKQEKIIGDYPPFVDYSSDTNFKHLAIIPLRSCGRGVDSFSSGYCFALQFTNYKKAKLFALDFVKGLIVEKGLNTSDNFIPLAIFCKASTEVYLKADNRNGGNEYLFTDNYGALKFGCEELLFEFSYSKRKIRTISYHADNSSDTADLNFEMSNKSRKGL